MLAADTGRAASAQAGLTLVEFIVALSILAILIGIAAPSFRTFLATTRVTSAANELFSSSQFARTEAVRRSRLIRLCPSTNGTSCAAAPAAPAQPDWAAGWIVWEDRNANSTPDAGEVLKVHPALNTTLTINGPAALVFGKLGQTASASFTVQSAGALSSRYLCVAASGAPRVLTQACPA